jgi:uncharacterized membrane-anchored protein
MKKLKKIIQSPKCSFKHSNAKLRMAILSAMVLLTSLNQRVHASNAIITKVNTVYTLVIGIIGAAGGITLAWGIFEFASSYQSHDSSTQTQALKKVISGILMCAASALVNLLK